MFIKSLRLVNFKNIKDTTFNNWSRINGILGPNGSGKTTLLQAIQLIVLSKTPKKFKLSDFIGDFGDQFEIYSNFSHLGIDYDFSMIYNGESEKILKFSNTDEEELRNSQVNNYMGDLFDSTLALNSAFSFQNETSLILEQDPAERLEQLKKILLDKEELDEKELLLDNKLIEIKNALFLIDKEIKVLESKEFNFESELSFLDNRDQLQQQILIYKEKQKDYDQQCLIYEENSKIYNKKQSEYQILLQNYYSQISLIDKEYNEKDKIYIVYLQQLKEYNLYLEKLDEYNKNKQDLLNKIQNKPVDRSKVCKYIDDDLNQIQSKINTLTVEASKLAISIELAKQGKCSKCGADYTGTDINELLNQEKNIQEEYKKLNSDYIQVKNEIADYKLYEEKRLRCLFQISEYEKQLQNLKEPDKIDNPIEVSKIEKPIYPVSPKFDLEIVIKPKLEQNYSLLISHCEKEILNIDFKYNENEKIKQRNLQVLEKKQQNDIRIQENKIKLEEMYQKQDVLKKSKQILKKDLPVFIINLGIANIKSLINKFFTTVYSKYIIDIQSNEKGDGIDILFDNGIKVRNINLASGSEKQICATALRFALCKLQNIGLYIGDEIDSNADTENSEKLLEEIYNNQDFEQIILISHNVATKESLTNISDCAIIELQDGNLIQK